MKLLLTKFRLNINPITCETTSHSQLTSLGNILLLHFTSKKRTIGWDETLGADPTPDLD